jgi:segregation and condensation protein A
MAQNISNSDLQMISELDLSIPHAEEKKLLLDIDGFEGPLDVLLALSRSQKVDLSKISILELVESYLKFISAAHEIRLELAADYLVMAAWLAYLKSRLLLPVEEQADDLSAEDMAAKLAYKLQRLEAVRKFSASLMSRDRLGRDFFARGDGEPLKTLKTNIFQLDLYDILKCYADVKARSAICDISIHKREIYTLDQALNRLTFMLDQAISWTDLKHFMPPQFLNKKILKSAKASLFTAALELARQGKINLNQKQTFGKITLMKI